MRLYAVWGLVMFLMGVIVFSPAFSLAQERPETQRKIAEKVVPAYPDLARKMQIHGTVRVGVVVTPAVKLKLAQVIGGNPVLVKAALDAIENGGGCPHRKRPKSSSS